MSGEHKQWEMERRSQQSKESWLAGDDHEPSWDSWTREPKPKARILEEGEDPRLDGEL
jgi:hypothetical protein